MGSIVWLASYPRSGNTWTRSFLHALLSVLRGEESTPDINAMHQLTTWDVYPHWWKERLAVPLGEATQAQVAAARPRVQAEIASKADGVVFVKTHNALVRNHGQPTINMAVTSGAIYIVRNPLDAVISNAHHFDLELDEAIERLNRPGLEMKNHEDGAYEVYGAWRENVLSWTRRPHRTIYVMRYEDMLAKPEATFGALAAHLTLQPNAAQLAAAIARSSFERLKRQEAEKGFKERPKRAREFFREGRAEQWRERLSRRQARAVIEANREQMARFDYLPKDFQAPPARAGGAWRPSRT